MTDEIAYLTPEAKARIEIDRMLAAAGWAVQDASRANLTASRGVAVREFILKSPHGRADYLLFVDGAAAGVMARVVLFALEQPPHVDVNEILVRPTAQSV